MIEDATARFEALVVDRGESVPLDDAVLLIAAHARPQLDLAAQRARLDAIAVGVAVPTLDALRSHLIDDLGFGGDHVTYHDARNSLLPEVLDRRVGIPLTLAILAIEVGRRCGVPLEGVGMPGHFLVRAADEPDRYLDLFDGGVDLDAEGCRAIFHRLHAGQAWDDRFLDPVGPLPMVTRMLANLANAYRRSGDRRGLSWALDLRLRLPGATGQERRELALLLGAVGRYDAAAALLEDTGLDRDQQAAARLRARLN